jgi:hypothetical protein
VAEALRANAGLTSLDLGGNRIGNEGATSLFAALRGNRALTDLHLDFNGISDERSLRDALCPYDVLAGVLGARENTTLTNLWLHGNRITAAYDAQIAAGLRHNAKLVPRALVASCQRLALAALLRPPRRRPNAPTPPSDGCVSPSSTSIIHFNHPRHVIFTAPYNRYLFF